jgi:hypothetical protein
MASEQGSHPAGLVGSCGIDGWLGRGRHGVRLTLASGRAVPGFAGARQVGEFIFAVVDITAGIPALTRKSRPAGWRGRHERRAARRAVQEAGKRPGPRGFLRRSIRLFWQHDALATLPRQVGRMLVAAYWASMAACGWQLVATMLAVFGASDGTARDEALGVSVVMVHLVVWCWLACRTLGRRHGLGRLQTYLLPVI